MDVNKHLLAWIDPEEAIALTQDLVRIPSITGQEGNAITDFICDWFRQFGFSPIKQRVADHRSNFIVRLEGKPGRSFILEGHQDTKWVEGMEIDPFGAEIKDGKLYGRGACDMKAGLAAMMVALKTLKLSGLDISGTVSLVSEVGEEGGGGGLPRLEEGDFLGCDAAVVAEPSNLDVQIGNRGGYRNTFVTYGKTAHSGTAHKGINAIEKMVKVVGGLRQLPYLKVRNPMWGSSSLNIMAIESKGWDAGVPFECALKIDSRLIPDTPPQEVHEQVVGLFHTLEKNDPEFRYDRDCLKARGTPALLIPENHKLVRTARTAVEEVARTPAVLSGNPGHTMAGYFIRRGIPAIVLGPGSLEQAHATVEWVEISQIPAAARIYTLLAYHFLSS